MLILIAGITGNIGQHAATAGLSRSHQIRGLGRNPNKLPSSIHDNLESFIVSKNYWDIAALEKAVEGVDAVICAYAGMPELALDGQLLLLRAAERAGIKRFLAASWNYDWRNISLGDVEVYDPYITFHAQASLSSSIKPLYILTGVLAEVFFGMNKQDGFTPKDDGVWEPRSYSPASNQSNPAMDIYGTGHEPWHITTEADAGAFAVAVVTGDDAEEGGFRTLFSWKTSLSELKSVYELVHPEREVVVREKGSVEALEERAVRERSTLGRGRFWEYQQRFFHAFTVKGVWALGEAENARYDSVRATRLEEFLRANPEV